MVYELSPLDRHFADFLVREGGGKAAILKHVASLLSCRAGKGDICLNLREIAGKEILVDQEKVRFPALEELQETLAEMPAVGAPGEFRPLILDVRGRLYLYRYWKYEGDVARIILNKTGMTNKKIVKETLGDMLDVLFPDSAGKSPDWQKVAAVAALRKSFLVVSGGPGTGKTSTVIRIIALLLAQEGPLRIALAAPTGKAAMRLKESILTMKERLPCTDAVKEQIPSEVATIHRLLGPIPGSARFRHSTENPLPHDAVIIDEASMVALPMMAKLAVALKADSRLILIGDRNQLASVEAGAVLGDICGGGRPEIFSEEFRDLYDSLTGTKIPISPADGQKHPLEDSLVILKDNYRFPAASGIGAAGREVNEGSGKSAVAIFKDNSFPDVAWQNAPNPEGLQQAIAKAVMEGYGPYLRAATASEALGLFDRFRFLCALNQGPYGVAGINGLIEGILAAAGLIDWQTRWYKGRPVMITVNDYNMKLFNGDVGIAWPDREAQGKLRVYFPSDTGIRAVSPLRLPAHETVYAMTVHKSQGSEYDRIHMIFPPHDSEVMTRELIYTGITRAKKRVDIWGDEELTVKAVARKTQRASGLEEKLWEFIPGVGSRTGAVI